MKKLAFLLPTLITMIACSTLPLSQPTTAAAPLQPTQPVAADTIAPAPTDTLPPPTETAVTTPELVEKVQQEENASPAYKLDVKYPSLENSSLSGAFNTLVESIVQANIDDFKTQAGENDPPPCLQDMPDVSSGLIVEYKDTLMDENMISVLLSFSPYIACSAHPGLFTRAVNFDMHQGRDLQLADLFLPQADYLTPIATFCKDDLSSRDALQFPEGADPMETNYQNWNLFPDGLRINFDPYQVAPWAAGSQEVFIPFTQLEEIIDPAGPLAPYLQ